jgi:putative transposase
MGLQSFADPRHMSPPDQFFQFLQILSSTDESSEFSGIARQGLFVDLPLLERERVDSTDARQQHHPHVHCVVPGGGLSPNGSRVSTP